MEAPALSGQWVLKGLKRRKRYSERGRIYDSEGTPHRKGRQAGYV